MLPAYLTQPRGKVQGWGAWGVVGLNIEEGMGPMQEKGSPVCEITRSEKHARVAAGLRPRAFSAPGPLSG